jgi:molybdate transport system substrate-binding protein
MSQVLWSYAVRAASVGLVTLLAHTCPADAAQIKLISASTMAPVVTELVAHFERTTGHKLDTTFVSGLGVKREVDAGTAFDAVIGPASVVDELVKEGKLVAATRVNVAFAGIGVGVRPGAPKPDVSSVDGFKRALLGATAVAHSAEGASGAYFRDLLQRLGISRQMAAKLRPLSGERLARAIPSGEADMLVVTMSVIPSYGADLAGPIPTELQFYNRFAAGVTTKASETETATALVRFLTTPQAIAIIKAKGMEPGAPRR